MGRTGSVGSLACSAVTVTSIDRVLIQLVLENRSRTSAQSFQHPVPRILSTSNNSPSSHTGF